MLAVPNSIAGRNPVNSEDYPTLESEPKSTLTDKLGIFGSTLCLIHCLVLPFILPLLSAQAYSPHLSGIESLFHLVIFPALLLTAVIAFRNGYKQHHNINILVLGIMGVLLISSGVVSEYLLSSDPTEALTASGSAVLVISHLLNIYALRQAKPHIHSSSCGCKSVSGNADVIQLSKYRK